MNKVIDAIEKSKIIKELNDETFIRETNYSNHQIFIVDHSNSPQTLLEIGRLREITFRNAGGGTGKELDLDEFDTRSEAFYKQLIVWDPDQKEIIGGYRFIKGAEIINSEKFNNLATNGLFDFSNDFYNRLLPKTIELGRSFVQPNYQPASGNRKAIFSLDNLWDGLGALVVDHPEIKYFFGKVTMYLDYNKKGRDLILTFINHFFKDSQQLIIPKKPLLLHHDTKYFVNEIKNLEYKEAYKILNKQLKSYETAIPPLIAAYMNLSSSMKSFGTVLNSNFGDVEETGILISIDDIYTQKKDRHINTYKEN